jgi:hypothetical protein
MTEIIDRIGEWNPQFYREIKGKLTRRNVILTVILSLIVQFVGVLPGLVYHSEEYLWELNWQTIFLSLTWLLPFGLLVVGVYLIASDLSREQARGTLNFVRLSPQPSESILLGKLLGVPILLYFGLALAIPLHLTAGIAAEMSWFRMIGVYPLWCGLCGLFYTMTLLIALLPQNQSEDSNQKSVVGASSLLALIAASTVISAIEYGFYAYDQDVVNVGFTWFLLPLQGIFAYFWVLATLGAVSWWIWQAANRRFRNPNRALLSKFQSYRIVIGTQLWLLGFAVPVLVNSEPGVTTGFGLFCLFFITPIEVLMLASLLSPDRQTLLDWTRYRHQQSRRDRAFWKDLFLGEKSPAVAAIALNLGLAALIWSPWLLILSLSDLFVDAPPEVKVTHLSFLLGLWMTAALILIYTTIHQLVRFYAKTSKQAIAIAFPGLVVAFLPLILAGVYTLSPAQMPLLWLFSPVPVAGIFYASPTSLILGFLGQLGILGLLVRHLHQTLKQAGISESKKLFLQQKI